MRSDAIGVAVMLDVARVLVDRKQPVHAPAVFLFNGAEGRSYVSRLRNLLTLASIAAETLQDASHLYSTQHETRHR